MISVPRAVVVTRCTPYEALLQRHATRGQAAFFLSERGQEIEPVEQAHIRQMWAVSEVKKAIPDTWRRTHVDREDLDRFLFEPDDVLIAVGQDGLVANMAKYLEGQPVIGINPMPDLFDGILVRHPPGAAEHLMVATAKGNVSVESRTMVQAGLDDGQRLLALNEIFVGHRSHQSARYRLSFGQQEERHSSSGLIVASGTGATGWAKSIRRSRREKVQLPKPRDRKLAFLVPEAFPSRATGVDLTSGSVSKNRPLKIVSEMDEGGVIFGDGIEDDFLDFGWGQEVVLSVAEHVLSLGAA